MKIGLKSCYLAHSVCTYGGKCSELGHALPFSYIYVLLLLPLPLLLLDATNGGMEVEKGVELGTEEEGSKWLLSDSELPSVRSGDRLE